jgi:[ribosomal protein S5]-alanine N-acetyltransferase
VTAPLPPWPAPPPAHGGVLLRRFTDDDLHLALELGSDTYVPLIGTLPAHPNAEQGLAWIRRQHDRYTEGSGLSFVVADAGSGRALGTIGLWLRHLSAGRAEVGYSVAPRHRGRGVGGNALRAVTAFAWTVQDIHRIELYIEPWNAGSLGVATAAGYRREGLLRSHQEIGGTRRDMLLYAAVRA